MFGNISLRSSPRDIIVALAIKGKGFKSIHKEFLVQLSLHLHVSCTVMQNMKEKNKIPERSKKQKLNWSHARSYVGFPGGSVVKNLPANAGDAFSIPGLERSPAIGNGYPLQYSCLGNPCTEELGGLQYMGLQGVNSKMI